MSEADDIIISNLVEKDSMKVSLSHSDPGAIQHNFIRSDSLDVKVAQIKITQTEINNAFYLNHEVNSQLDNTSYIMDGVMTELTSVTITVDI